MCLTRIRGPGAMNPMRQLLASGLMCLTCVLALFV